ncbi:hypothetical protein MMC11_008445 [Xylographa trunciseda]|nr:hypothetical protein [Xylographa trunciseda]
MCSQHKQPHRGVAVADADEEANNVDVELEIVDDAGPYREEAKLLDINAEDDVEDAKLGLGGPSDPTDPDKEDDGLPLFDEEFIGVEDGDVLEYDKPGELMDDRVVPVLLDNDIDGLAFVEEAVPTVDKELDTEEESPTEAPKIGEAELDVDIDTKYVEEVTRLMKLDEEDTLLLLLLEPEVFGVPFERDIALEADEDTGDMVGEITKELEAEDALRMDSELIAEEEAPVPVLLKNVVADKVIEKEEDPIPVLTEYIVAKIADEDTKGEDDPNPVLLDNPWLVPKVVVAKDTEEERIPFPELLKVGELDGEAVVLNEYPETIGEADCEIEEKPTPPPIEAEDEEAEDEGIPLPVLLNGVELNGEMVALDEKSEMIDEEDCKDKVAPTGLPVEAENRLAEVEEIPPPMLLDGAETDTEAVALDKDPETIDEKGCDGDEETTPPPMEAEDTLAEDVGEFEASGVGFEAMSVLEYIKIALAPPQFSAVLTLVVDEDGIESEDTGPLLLLVLMPAIAVALLADVTDAWIVDELLKALVGIATEEGDGAEVLPLLLLLPAVVRLLAELVDIWAIDELLEKLAGMTVEEVNETDVLPLLLLPAVTKEIPDPVLLATKEVLLDTADSIYTAISPDPPHASDASPAHATFCLLDAIPFTIVGVALETEEKLLDVTGSEVPELPIMADEILEDVDVVVNVRIVLDDIKETPEGADEVLEVTKPLETNETLLLGLKMDHLNMLPMDYPTLSPRCQVQNRKDSRFQPESEALEAVEKEDIEEVIYAAIDELERIEEVKPGEEVPDDCDRLVETVEESELGLVYTVTVVVTVAVIGHDAREPGQLHIRKIPLTALLPPLLQPKLRPPPPDNGGHP